MPIPKLALLNGIFCVCSRKLVIYYEHIVTDSRCWFLKLTCIVSFVYDETISINQCRQHKNPNNFGRATVFAKDNAADLLLQKVTQYVKSFNIISKNVQLVPKLSSTHSKLTLVTAHSRPKKCLRGTFTQQKLLAPSEYRSTVQVGSFKNQFHHHRTGRNNQRLKHDAAITSNDAPLAI